MGWEDINQNLSTRKKDTMISLIEELSPHENLSCETLIIQSANDLGVILNGGRNGSLHGPRAIVNNFKKMANTNLKQKITLTNSCEKSKYFGPNNISSSFDHFQKEQTLEMNQILKNKHQKSIHIGSGHDFIYPFVSALMQMYKNVAVINFDAHLDTRVDKIHHSGTPFRQLKNEFNERLNLTQIGIHDYANAASNFTNVDMLCYSISDVRSATKNMIDNHPFILSILSTLNNYDCVVLSLDLDAIASFEMSAVSAPNHDGLSIQFIKDFIELANAKYLGIYEYNPLFDDLAVSNARRINALIHKFIAN